jgi:hypothetical protein
VTGSGPHPILALGERDDHGSRRGEFNIIISEFGFLQTGVCPEGETRRLQGDHPVSGDVREPQLRQSV